MFSPTETLNPSIAVFSKNYLPISRVNLRRAVVLLVTGKAEPLEGLGGASWEVRSPSLILQVPAYIRLTFTSPERLWKVPTVNRREVLRRDRHQCQYCGHKKQLTLDHVIPRSRGGTHTWDNVVAACAQCNSRKSDRTPQEAGMILRSIPKVPIHPAIAFTEQFWRELHVEKAGGRGQETEGNYK